MVMFLPRIRLPTSHECLTTLKYQHIHRCFQIYKFSTFYYTADLQDFMSGVAQSLLKIMRQLFNTPCKVQISMKFLFTKCEYDDMGRQLKISKTVITKERQARIFNDGDAREYIGVSMERFDRFIDQWSEHGSGWTLDHIINLCYHVSLIKRVCGNGACTLPQRLKNKKAVLNLDSPYGECLQYAIVASIHYADVVDQHDHLNHASKYKDFIQSYNFTCFAAPPVDVCELKHFEKLNPTVSVTAIIWEEQNVDQPQ